METQLLSHVFVIIVYDEARIIADALRRARGSMHLIFRDPLMKRSAVGTNNLFFNVGWSVENLVWKAEIDSRLGNAMFLFLF